MGRRKITVIHASRVSIEPLNGYYPKEMPELEITNLLDDGIMGLFSAGDMPVAMRRLRDMISVGHEVYGAELAMLACSAVPRSDLEELRAAASIPVLKIDEPMAHNAVRTGRRIGVIVTFPPTQNITHALLTEAAAEEGIEIRMSDELVPEALHAVLSGDRASHARLLTAAAERLVGCGVEAIVLPQVSMAHLVPVLRQQTGLPIFSSLETSLAELRQKLAM
jgi:Asp/Glu/hydantoin racemase